MVRCLSWRAKVVRNLIFALCIGLTFPAAFSQSVNTTTSGKRISLSVNGRYFHDVIDHLASITDLHFIYSSNKIEANTLISLSVIDSSLEEVLGLLGKQMNLTFKVQGRYVIIKTAPAAPASNIVKPLRSERPVENFNRSPLATQPRDSSEAVASTADRTLSLTETSLTSDSDENFRRHLKRIQPYFNTALIKKLPPYEIRKINTKNNHPGWFVSGGFMVNDYSAGVELQAGIKPVYLIWTPAWLGTGKYYGGYGVGTSIALKANFSFSPAYMYGHRDQKETYFERGMYGRVTANQVAFTAKHHQFKVMMQYNVSENIQIRMGPVFNYMLSRYSYPVWDKTIVINGSPLEDYGARPTSSTPVTVTVIRESKQGSYQDFKSWVGWQAGISYRINFFRRP